MFACSAPGDTPMKQNSIQKKPLGFQSIFLALSCFSTSARLQLIFCINDFKILMYFFLEYGTLF